MLFTEKESKAKWCPFVRAMNFQPMEGQNPAVNRESNNFNCIASACAAWRWSEYERDERGHTRGKDRRGFCGLAGPLVKP